METKCVLIKLKPESLEHVREWAKTLNTRRNEALETLRDEGVHMSPSFLLNNKMEIIWSII